MRVHVVWARELVLIRWVRFGHTVRDQLTTKQIGNNIELNNNVGKNNILNYIIAILLQMIGYQSFFFVLSAV